MLLLSLFCRLEAVLIHESPTKAVRLLIKFAVGFSHRASVGHLETHASLIAFGLAYSLQTKMGQEMGHAFLSVSHGCPPACWCQDVQEWSAGQGRLRYVPYNHQTTSPETCSLLLVHLVYKLEMGKTKHLQSEEVREKSWCFCFSSQFP